MVKNCQLSGREAFLSLSKESEGCVAMIRDSRCLAFGVNTCITWLRLRTKAYRNRRVAKISLVFRIDVFLSTGKVNLGPFAVIHACKIC